MHTRKYQCRQFERDPFRNRQGVEFLEQSRYIVIVPGPTAKQFVTVLEIRAVIVRLQSR